MNVNEFDEFDVIVINELLRKQIAAVTPKRPVLQLEIPKYEIDSGKSKEVKDEPRRVIVIDL